MVSAIKVAILYPVVLLYFFKIVLFKIFMSHWATDTFLEVRTLVSPVLQQYYLLKDSVSRSYHIHLDRYTHEIIY